jgi:hypothetical protein
MNWNSCDLNDVDKKINNNMISNKVIIGKKIRSSKNWLEILKFSIQVLIGLLKLL